MTPAYLQSFWAFWERQPKNKQFLVSWVRQYSEGTDEPTIRKLLFGLLNWTGNQDPEITPYVDSPVDLLRGIDRLRDKNNGRGPEISCGPFAAIYVGLLAAFGIPARRVWSSRISDGFQDNVAEFWSASLKQWVLVVPQLCLHFEHPQTNRPLSLREWATYDRMGTHAKPVPVAGDGKPRFCDLTMDHWRGMSGNPCVMRGNWPYGGTETRPAGCWQYLQVWPRVGNAIESGGQDIARFGSYDERSVTGEP
jgi:hypothetical protein